MHRVKGEIYNDECLFRLSLEEYYKEKEMFDRAGLSSHSNYALMHVALVQNSLRDYEESVQTLLEVEGLAVDTDDYILQCLSQIYLCHIYIALSDYVSCS